MCGWIDVWATFTPFLLVGSSLIHYHPTPDGQPSKVPDFLPILLTVWTKDSVSPDKYDCGPKFLSQKWRNEWKKEKLQRWVTALIFEFSVKSKFCQMLTFMHSSQLMCFWKKFWIELSSNSNCDFAAISLDFVIFAPVCFHQLMLIRDWCAATARG